MNNPNQPENNPYVHLASFCRNAVWQEMDAINEALPPEAQFLARLQSPPAWDARRQAIIEKRTALYERLKQDDALAELMHHDCRNNILLWFRYFAWTYDPRPNPFQNGNRSIGRVPFVLYPFQMEVVLRLNEAIELGEDLLVEKSRDMGLSWLISLVFQYRWLFHSGQQFLVGSRKYGHADTRGDLSTLMEKCRFNLREQPVNMLPAGFDFRKHDVAGRLLNPQNGNTIIAEATTENFARGGRYSAVLLDEFAFWMWDDGAYAAAGQSTLCRLLVSTPNGRKNRFALERFSGLTPVLTVHWSLHPFKDKVWYTAQQRRLLKHEIARELDISYEYCNRDRVFEEFTVQHVAHVAYNPDLEILRSWDFGYHTPAVLALQRDEWGRVVVLKEWVGQRVVLKTFAQQVKDDCVAMFGPNARFRDVCDPAGHQHNDKSENTSIEVLNHMGIHPVGVRCGVVASIDKLRHLMIEERDVPVSLTPALSQREREQEDPHPNPLPEGEGAEPSSCEGLVFMREGQHMVKSPAFLVDAQHCPTLIDALQGGYRYVSNDSEELAQEHPFEDVADALRYAVWELGKLLMDSSDWARDLRKERYEKWVALEKLRRYNQRRGQWY
jgi:hypothetical protein